MGLPPGCEKGFEWYCSKCKEYHHSVFEDRIGSCHNVKKMEREEICEAFGVPPEIVGTFKGANEKDLFGQEIKPRSPFCKGSALFTSLDQRWRTPEELYECLDAEFHFDFDPCPPDPDFDGLMVEWGKSNFVNPPYDNILAWCQKAQAEHKKGKTVVMLIPSRTDVGWWHDYAMQAPEIRFCKGRLRFGGAPTSAPFASSLIIWKVSRMSKT
jgi:hypothetical protein